jgi:hypothetical protein
MYAELFKAKLPLQPFVDEGVNLEKRKQIFVKLCGEFHQEEEARTQAFLWAQEASQYGKPYEPLPLPEPETNQ